MRHLMRRSLVAGLVTGSATSLLALVILFAFDELHILWPLAYVPVFATGVVALSRARAYIRTSRAALLAGAAAGVPAALVSVATFFIATLWAQNSAEFIPVNASAYWSLGPILQSGPFFVSRDQLYYDLPFALPDWWAFRNPVTGVPQMLWVLTIFLPLGIALSALQAGLAYVLGERIAIPDRLVMAVAGVRRTFGSKLRMGFAVLIALIFVVGWLGFGSTEEMHDRLHRGRALQHWRDHIARIQTDLVAQTSVLGRLGNSPDAAALQQVTTIGQRVAADLAHLKPIPPPRHADPAAGRENMTAVAELSLAQVTEADVAFRAETAAIARVLDQYRAAKPAEAQAGFADIASARDGALRPLQKLDLELQQQMKSWLTGADSDTHAQQIWMMLLVLAATGIAFPLGYVFSQVVVRPVTAVQDGLERIARGDFAQRVEVVNRDELGDLASNINATGQELERLYGELRGLNEGLQQKVQEHVREIERSRMLRRYLPQQVADAVIASGDESLLHTHRREITVVFGDLRGFTAFAETGEPEVVMSVLSEYHGAVGELISKFAGTLEQFSGDGWMVYFNDPLPTPDHTARAVRMSVALRERIGELARQWRRHGYELDFGIGIAIGYATLGTIGFEGRHDYGAIGTVANLASRLSDEAKGGQILVNQRVDALVDEIAETQPVGDLHLKGFLKPVAAFNVIGLKKFVAPV